MQGKPIIYEFWEEKIMSIIGKSQPGIWLSINPCQKKNISFIAWWLAQIHWLGIPSYSLRIWIRTIHFSYSFLAP